MSADQRDLLPARAELETDFEFIRELGRGGMGVVYLARERDSGRHVALKLVRSRHLEEEETVRRFAREASTVTRLQHPAIVATECVRQLGTGDLALMMRYVPGPTLRELIRRHGAMSFETTERVLVGVAEALSYAHSQGIVHRDVKPENIFYADDGGRPVLSDFGIARPIEAESLTLTGVAIGTPSYMSPEQIDGSGIDGRSDLYGLGLVGWEMLTGRRPWDGESLYSVIYKQKNERLPSLERLRPGVPRHLLFAIEGALEKHRDDRWANADEFVAQLTDRSGAPHRRRAAFVPMVRSAEASPSMRVTTSMELPAAGYVGVDDALTIDDDDDAPFPALIPDRRFSRWQAALGGTLVILLAALIFVTTRPDTGVGGMFAAEGEAGEIIPSDEPWSMDSPAAAPTLPPPGAARIADSVVLDSSRVSDSVRMPMAPRDSAIVPALDQPDVATPAITISEAERQRRAAGARIERGPEAQSVARVVAPPAVQPPPTPAIDTVRPPARQVVAAETAAASAGASAPIAANDASSDAVSIVAGGTHTCIITRDGAGYCWGSNERGQLGVAGGGTRTRPVRIASGLRLASVSAGLAHSCAVAQGGGVYCWGANDQGQLGDGGGGARTAPAPVSGERRYRTVHAGLAHTCALGTDGQAYCWGANGSGQLGNGRQSGRATPGAVAGGTRFTALAVGWHHSCAITSSGSALCWGQNSAGQLGAGNSLDRSIPTAVDGGRRFSAITAGSAHSCALAGSEAYCWGRNSGGQLGDGSGQDQPRPVKVRGAPAFTSIAAGSTHTCGLTRSGEAYCWGKNAYGQLGDGTTIDRATPVKVRGDVAFASLDASGAHTCATSRSGESYCWGYNVDGQLGDGTRAHRARPVRAGETRE